VTMTQVEPSDVDQWTKVSFTNDGSSGDYVSAGVIISIFSSHTYQQLPGVSDVTMDACLPRPCNDSAAYMSVCLSVSLCLCMPQYCMGM